MKDYVIYTDSACDISLELLEKWGVYSSPLTFRFSDDDKEYSNYEMSAKDFYEKMCAGGIAKTAAINSETFALAFEEILKEGKDILYLGFSSGLSTTYNSARLASQQLQATYPDSKVIVVDTLAASAGQGLLVRLVLDKKNNGATIEEAANYAKEIVPNICHWFTVDDLVYLKRGGRISAAAAFFGNVIGIKPVLHVDNEGHLVNVMKVRGRRSAILTMAEKYEQTALDKENGTVYISHANCMKDVEELSSLIKSKCGASVDVITDVGPVIGAHSGPGTLALFFVGKER
jgi:DegV family protein with EDD domain